MLVLSRKIGETIVIEEGAITISLVAIRGERALIGVNAPREISVHREEIYQKIKEKNEQMQSNSLPVSVNMSTEINPLPM